MPKSQLSQDGVFGALTPNVAITINPILFGPEFDDGYSLFF